MGEFENGKIFNFQGLVTLTLDQVIQHTVVQHSSTSIYTPSLHNSDKVSPDGWTEVCMDSDWLH